MYLLYQTKRCYIRKESIYLKTISLNSPQRQFSSTKNMAASLKVRSDILNTGYLFQPVKTASGYIQPYCVIPSQGQLEMETYARDKLTSLHRNKYMSIPYLLFMDGFGLYRHMYCSIIEIYLISAGLGLLSLLVRYTRCSRKRPFSIGLFEKR
jgi:hypothetical protein